MKNQKTRFTMYVTNDARDRVFPFGNPSRWHTERARALAIQLTRTTFDYWYITYVEEGEEPPKAKV